MDFLFKYFHGFFGKLILISIGLLVFNLYFPSFYVDLIKVFKFMSFSCVGYLMSYDTALFLKDFFSFYISANFFSYLYFNA